MVRAALFSDGHLVKTFPASAIGKLKVNGEIGMDAPADEAAWNLDVAPLGGAGMKLTLADVRALPRYEETFEFKCIEGWSTVTQFAGARLSDSRRSLRRVPKRPLMSACGRRTKSITWASTCPARCIRKRCWLTK